MRVLGIDCGSERTGYGIVDSDGVSHRLVTAGVIRVPSKLPLPQRLLKIFRELERLIAEFAPEAAAIEDVFFALNAKSALKLGHVRGVAMLAAARAGVPVGEYSPLQVKSSVVGYGRAEKRQVQHMVKALLGLPEPPESEDAADALAIAICHVNVAHTALALAKKSSRNPSADSADSEFQSA
jgi:crossover junction endodeoxyribonuclease RuvC